MLIAESFGDFSKPAYRRKSFSLALRPISDVLALVVERVAYVLNGAREGRVSAVAIPNGLIVFGRGNVVGELERVIFARELGVCRAENFLRHGDSSVVVNFDAVNRTVLARDNSALQTRERHDCVARLLCRIVSNRLAVACERVITRRAVFVSCGGLVDNPNVRSLVSIQAVVNCKRVITLGDFDSRVVEVGFGQRDDIAVVNRNSVD